MPLKLWPRPTSRLQWKCIVAFGVFFAVVGAVLLIGACVSLIRRGPTASASELSKGTLSATVFAAMTITGVWACVATMRKPCPPRGPRRGYWACKGCGYDIGPMDEPVKTCPECGTGNDRPF